VQSTAEIVTAIHAAYQPQIQAQSLLLNALQYYVPLDTALSSQAPGQISENHWVNIV
jgi:hypothetical protein